MFPAEIKSKTVQPEDKKWTIPCAEITDKPQFPWRGLMLDVSRHWFTKEEVLKYIDELAEYKMNVFHWHLKLVPGVLPVWANGGSVNVSNRERRLPTAVSTPRRM